MSTMIKAAGAPEEKAKAAAEALSAYENRFNSVDKKLEKIDAEVGMLKWMVGLSIGLNLAILGLIIKQLA